MKTIKQVAKENKVLAFYTVWSILTFIILIILGGITLFSLGVLATIVVCSKLYMDLMDSD